MIGIYKITSPSNKIYVGQSINIEKRFKSYSKLHCYQQYKLYNSLKKYGYKQHIFEILEECTIEQLNIKERYWQDYYDVLSKNGLNLTLTRTDEKRKVYSPEIIDKIRESNLGKKKIYKSEESLERTKLTRFKLGSTVNNKKVINIETGEIFESAKQLAETLNKKPKYIQEALRKKYKQFKNYRYMEDIQKNTFNKQLICVYGTLRKGCGNYQRLLTNAEYMGTFNSKPVYTMYNLGGFPGLKENGNTSIVLEVFAVNEEEAAKVDRLEGYSENKKPTFYDKKQIDTPWGTAGIYIFVDDLTGVPIIKNGDWVNRNKQIYEIKQ